MLKEILDFKVHYPKLFWTIIVIIGIAIIIAVDYVMFEHIECKVTEKNGRTRDTHARRHRRTNNYELHQLSGKWKKITDEEILMLKEAIAKNQIPHFDFSKS